MDSVSRLVAGSEYRQPAFAGHSHGPHEFELRTEPTNPHDTNAVAVYLDSRHIGYLAAGAAKDYQPVVAHIEREGRFVISGVVDELQSEECARIELPELAALKHWLATPPERRLLAQQRSHFWIKRTAKHQDVLAKILGDEPTRTFPVAVEARNTPSGKYEGEPCLHFSLNGEEIGMLQSQYQEQAPGLHTDISMNGPKTMEATIRQVDDGKLIVGVEHFYN